MKPTLAASIREAGKLPACGYLNPEHRAETPLWRGGGSCGGINRSNYTERFDQVIDDAGGRAWVTEYASSLSALWISSPEMDVIRPLQASPYITRLRTRMLVDHLQEDLELTIADEYWDVSPNLVAWREINRPGGDCEDYATYRYGCMAASVSTRLGQAFGPTVIVLAVLMWHWRRSRRKL
jgi:hypothetical protein